ncbi:MAG: WbqC family protein [Myxococcota bacterium]|nr:WbqC family protein [Myxococcota bacterium]
MICAICQPHYFPWLGYFEMIDRADVFVFLDDVQFVDREWKNRNRIRKTETSEETSWLTVPVRREHKRSPINETLIASEIDWSAKHLAKIRAVYRHAPNFSVWFPFLEQAIEKSTKYETLSELNIYLVRQLCNALGIETETVRSSDLDAPGKREEKLKNICTALDAETYLANNATGDYVDASFFARAGIEMRLQNYEHPVYRQRAREETLSFISHLSVVDALLNVEGAVLGVIRSGNRGGNKGG